MKLCLLGLLPKLPSPMCDGAEALPLGRGCSAFFCWELQACPYIRKTQGPTMTSAPALMRQTYVCCCRCRRMLVQSLSVERAFRAVRRSEVAVLVLDASEGITQQDFRLSEYVVGGHISLPLFLLLLLLLGSQGAVQLQAAGLLSMSELEGRRGRGCQGVRVWEAVMLTVSGTTVEP